MSLCNYQQIVTNKFSNTYTLEKSQIFLFFALRNVRVLFKNQRKFEKWWGKRWELKKQIGEQFRKTVENECLGKISHFLINVPKPTENLRKCLKKFWRNFWGSLRKFLRKSEKYFSQRPHAKRDKCATSYFYFSFMYQIFFNIWVVIK